MQELIDYRGISPEIVKERIEQWAAGLVAVRGGSANVAYRTAGANLKRWIDGSRQPRNNAKNAGLILAVLGYESKEELERLILEVRSKTAGGSGLGDEVRDAGGRYDPFGGPLQQLAKKLYQQRGFAEQLQELEPAARVLIESCWLETTKRAEEADRSFALLDRLLNPSKKG